MPSPTHPLKGLALDRLRRRRPLDYDKTSDWPTPAKLILEHGETRTLTPFDRLGQIRSSQGKSLPSSSSTSPTYEPKTSASSPPSTSPRKTSSAGGHPSFGTVTLSQLLAAGAVHDMTRLHQVSRILATSTAKP